MPDEPDAIDASSSEFIAEIKEDLAGLEPDLLIMEEKGAGVDDDLINHAFRSIHSIKGGAGFINFTALSSLSHDMENVLMKVREKRLVITSDIVDALLAGFDCMKFLVDQAGTAALQTRCSEQQAALRKIFAPEAVVSSRKKAGSSLPDEPDEPDTGAGSLSFEKGKDRQEPETAALGSEDAVIVLQPLNDTRRFKDREFTVDRFKFEQAREHQKFVYAVHIRPGDDIQGQPQKIKAVFEDIKSIGEILYSDLDAENIEPLESGFFCVITTILDLPLLSQVLEINKTQVALVGRKMPDGTLEPDPCPVFMPEPDGADKSKDGAQKDQAALPKEKQEKSLLNFQSTALPAGQTIRVNVDLVTRLMNRAGELVLSRNQLRPIMESMSAEQRQAPGVMQNLDMVTTDIQQAVMQMRMQPIGDLVGKYRRVVRDIARRMSKKVDFLLEGEDVDVDRNILEKLANPLTHLIRNCIDHGIEPPERRIQAGKPETGIIRIQTTHQGGYVHIRVSDDGAGIDPQLILSKAFEKGLISETLVETLTDKQKIDLILLPGFSTTEEITDISGRGVGMDVVKTNIERLRGQIEIDSSQGRGTCVHLIIPLTLTVVPSLIFGAGDARFAVPQANIKEVIYLEPDQIHAKVEKIAGSEVLRLRDQWLPVIRLRNVLSIQTYLKAPDSGRQLAEKRRAIADRRAGEENIQYDEKRAASGDRRKNAWDATYVMILKLGEHRFGLCVDELFDIEEVVVEPLDQYLKHLPYFAGATILGDGRVTMILDVAGIASACELKFHALDNKDATDGRNRREPEEAQAPSASGSLIVFGHNSREYFGLPLDCVSRLEPVAISDIHHSGEQKFFDYHGEAVELFSMDAFLPVTPFEGKEEMFVVFVKHIRARAGILVSLIVDSIETDLLLSGQSLSADDSCPDLIAGKLFVEGSMIQVLDHDRFFQQLDAHAFRTKDTKPFRP